MNRALITEALSLFILSAAGIYGGVELYLNRDPRTQSSVMAPGMYVLVLGALLLLTTLLYVCVSYKRADPASSVASAAPRGPWVSPIVVKMVAAFAVYAYLIDFVGYTGPTLLFLLIEFRLLGVRSWRTNVLLTAVATALFYLVFVHYCEMVFPRGSLFE